VPTVEPCDDYRDAVAAYHHPLAILLGLQGVALLRAEAGDNGFDREFVEARLSEVARLVTAGLDGGSGMALMCPIWTLLVG
jgi:hypothetical protein